MGIGNDASAQALLAIRILSYAKEQEQVEDHDNECNMRPYQPEYPRSKRYSARMISIQIKAT